MNWTYDILKKNVAEYLGRDDLGELLPTFVTLAEQRLQTELRLRCMEYRATHPTTPGEESLALPDRRIPGDWDVFLEMREVSLAGSPAVNLEYVSPDRFTDLAGGRGRPAVYTIVGREMLLAPTPDAAHTALLTYYGQIPPLGEHQPTNDFLLSHPRLYLYGSLLESAAYARSSAPAELWRQYYNEAKTNAEFGDARARFSRQLCARPPYRGAGAVRSHW